MPVNLRPVLILDLRPVAALGIGVTENVDFTATAPMAVIDAHNVASATAGVSGRSTLSRQPAAGGGYNTVTAALVMDTVSALVRAAVITVAQRTIAVGDTLRGVFVDGGGAGGANGNLYAHLVMLPITGA